MSDVNHVLDSPAAVKADRNAFSRVGLNADNEIRHIRRRLVVGGALIVGDILASRIAVGTSHFLSQLLSPSAEANAYLPTDLIVLVFLALGLYFGTGQSPYGRFRLRGIGILLFLALDCLAAGKSQGPIRLIFEIASSAGLLLVIGFYMECLVRHLLLRYGFWLAPTALVGCGETAQTLFKTLTTQPELGLRPVGFIRTAADTDTTAATLPAPVLGRIEEFTLVGRDVEFAILTSRDQLAVTNILSDRLPPAQLILLHDVSDIQTLWVRTHALGNAVGIHFKRDPYLTQNRWLKRAIDLSVAVPAFVFFVPLIAAVALLIKLVDRGPAFYFQPRIGGKGRVFNVPKLRTMYLDASERLESHLLNNPQARNEWDRFFKLTNDPRILPVIGNFIRRTSLDELPQLWSVIVGDMSLVGPRPFPAYHMDRFDPEFRSVRTVVPPGLTGLWQVSARSNGDLDVQRAQDTFYIRNWSIWLDIYILLQTLPAVMSTSGAR